MFGVFCAVGVCLTVEASLGRVGMGIFVVGVRGLWWITRFFARASGGAIGGVSRGVVVGVRWMCTRSRPREVIVVRRALSADVAVAAHTYSQRGVRFNTNMTTIVRGCDIPRSGSAEC